MTQPIPQVGETIAGKYRVESVLGRGGMGVVFAARHAISERRVAVKWMEADLQDEPDALERFVREARAMGRIEHPNVVGVLDVGTEGPIAYLVMEILRGESLRALIAREHRMAPELALKTLLPVMEGVEAAHRAGVVHRDLKPENLFVVRGANGEAVTTKVLDFGISKLTENDSKKREARRLTKTGHVVGTPTYMAPEQVRGGTVDGRTDVWALATILYEILSGGTPFSGDNYGALLVAIAVEPYAPLDPAIVPPDLARVVHKGLAKEPDDRWQSVLDFARALEPFARGVTFVEPRRPSLVPAQPLARPALGRAAERESAVPTLQAGKRPELTTQPRAPAPSGVKTPELDLPAPRVPPANGTRLGASPAGAGAPLSPGSPTPIRLGRTSVSDADDALPAPSPNRRLMTIAAVALAVVVALVFVIRGIGRATRDAALPAPTSVALPVTVVPPPDPIAPPPDPMGPDPIAPPRPSDVPSATVVSRPALPTTVGVDPPPTTAHGRHGDGAHAHGAPPSTTGAATTTGTTGAPPTTTATSRSGSITREDF